MSTGLKVILIGFAAIAGLLLICRIMKRGGGRAFLLSALQGVAAVFAVNLLGTVIPVTLAVNWWSLGTAAAAGLPGVVGMIVLNTVMRT